MNGIQTQSALTLNLIGEVDDLAALGVDVLRISPQSQHTGRIIETFHARLSGDLDAARACAALDKCAPLGECDGYWHGKAGMHRSENGSLTRMALT